MSDTSTARVAFTAHTVTRTVEYTIDGAGPMTMGWGYQQFTPRRLVVTVERTADADWAMKAVVAHGPRLLKSGKDGQDMRERDLHTRVSGVDGLVYCLVPEAPDWVDDCVHHTMREAR
ncbi:hypothetical protein [Prescottella agglutinans]|uniref:Uncharacterized protein n=1 Tax=Prescottella agglutinans TaxID=1644129 RepID=A0ABT6MI85_9NOCA|nr:hypothetical protein [Prescottella agglutinans]MDH6284033.1 hypothetical protein [Prescottella agglutinans]